tara:strand:+ start:4069 stop:4335 length:267 start_codon:yes stop_codon:yes gene_type:complete
MAINIEKILNIEIREYCDSRYKNITCYDLKGVHLRDEQGNPTNFADLVPDKAEVVVNYQHNFFGTGSRSQGSIFEHHQMGVALIPKND